MEICLSNLEKVTDQEVFDRVSEHLLSQKMKAFDDNGVGCAYRSKSGLCCAAGCLISDDEYIPELEGKNWNTLVTENKVPGYHSDLIKHLQVIHDDTNTGDWKRNLVYLAILKQLDFSSLSPTPKRPSDTSIRRVSGGWFDYKNPSFDDLSIIDISIGLTNVNRYSGQQNFENPYSVMMHSIAGYFLLMADGHTEAARTFLCHDISEAFTQDISSPLKSLIPDFREIEDSLQSKAYSYYWCDTSKGVMDRVHAMDNRLFEVERRMIYENNRAASDYDSDAYEFVKRMRENSKKRNILLFSGALQQLLSEFSI